jgi:hypothetical protein
MKKLFVFLIIFNMTVLAHPVNLTKMDLNLSNKNLHLRFISFNIEKAFDKQYENETEIKNDSSKIIAYTKKHIKIYSGDGECKLIPENFNVKNEIVIDEYFKVKCKDYNKLKIYFDMFFKEDSTQMGLLKIFTPKKEYVLNFKPKETVAEVEISKPVSFLKFVQTGIEHILRGFDHITFLLMLLLPAIMYNKKIKSAIKDVLIIATAFTISHSTSLMLSAFGILTPPPDLIEILITVTIFITALNNIFHFVNYNKEWLIAFLFGFIHGFAFSEAVRGLELSFKNFVKIVLGFNLGVEIGQILIIITVLPVLFIAIKKFSKIYYILSLMGAFLAFLWFVDRVTGFGFMPF